MIFCVTPDSFNKSFNFILDYINKYVVLSLTDIVCFNLGDKLLTLSQTPTMRCVKLRGEYRNKILKKTSN